MQLVAITLISEQLRWLVRYGNLFVLLFFVGVLYFLAQVKTTERASYPVYFETAENGHFVSKLPPRLQPHNCITGNYILQRHHHFLHKSFRQTPLLPDQPLKFTLPLPAAGTLQPQQQAGTLVNVNHDVSIFSCFVNQLLRQL